MTYQKSPSSLLRNVLQLFHQHFCHAPSPKLWTDQQLLYLSSKWACLTLWHCQHDIPGNLIIYHCKYDFSRSVEYFLFSCLVPLFNTLAVGTVKWWKECCDGVIITGNTGNVNVSDVSDVRGSVRVRGLVEYCSRLS